MSMARLIRRGPPRADTTPPPRKQPSRHASCRRRTRPPPRAVCDVRAWPDTGSASPGRGPPASGVLFACGLRWSMPVGAQRRVLTRAREPPVRGILLACGVRSSLATSQHTATIHRHGILLACDVHASLEIPKHRRIITTAFTHCVSSRADTRIVCRAGGPCPRPAIMHHAHRPPTQ
jgi:hypothetical protein